MMVAFRKSGEFPYLLSARVVGWPSATACVQVEGFALLGATLKKALQELANERKREAAELDERYRKRLSDRLNAK